MKKIIIEGVATISNRGFHFDSGLPSDEPIMERAQCLHGQMKIQTNGCAEFIDNGRIYLPPEVHTVGEGENYRVKRTTRNYIIQIKVPIVESRATSQRTLKGLVPVVMGDITLDRREILAGLSPTLPTREGGKSQDPMQQSAMS